MTDVISFEEAIKASGSLRRTILLGNGFSIAQGGNRFSYSSLLEKSGLGDGSPIRKAFQMLETFDFEIVMKALEHASQIEAAYNDEAKAKKFREDAAAVRESLIHAIIEVHPGAQFEVPDKHCDACAKFLIPFDTIITLNYDLLLYWVILRAGATKSFRDGFGLDGAGDFRKFSFSAHCNTYYLHGALHLFLDQERETLKRVLTDTTIINDITDTIRKGPEIPLIVAEGTATQKIARIRSVPYLNHCFETLASLGGNLIILGHGVSDSDTHIYDAICRSRLKKIFFCVHNPGQRLGEVREQLARYAERRQDIVWSYVDAATANVWGPQEASVARIE
jgi:hypothetical protein